jgi:hypothetical protein
MLKVFGEKIGTAIAITGALVAFTAVLAAFAAAAAVAEGIIVGVNAIRAAAAAGTVLEVTAAVGVLGAEIGALAVMITKSFPYFVESIKKAKMTGKLIGHAISLGLIFPN